MQEKSLKKNIALNILYKPISLVLSLLYTRILLNYAGSELYGTWSTVSAFLTWINYFDIGIGNGLRNRLTQELEKKDFENARSSISTAYFALSIISIIFVGVVVFLTIILKLPDRLGWNSALYRTNEAFIVSMLFTGINFVLSLYKMVLFARQQASFISFSGIVLQMIQLVIFVFLLFNTKANLMLLSLTFGVSTVGVSMFFTFWVFHKMPEVRPSLKCIKKNSLMEIGSQGVKFFIMQITALIFNSTDKILIQKLYGASQVTVYDIVCRIFMTAGSLHQLIIGPMWSAFTAAKIKNDYVWIKKTLKTLDKIAILFCIGACLLGILFKPLAAIWLGQELQYPLLLIWTYVVYICLVFVCNGYTAFLCGIGNINIPTILNIIGAVANIPLSLLFALKFKMGLGGIVIGTILCQLPQTILYPILTKRWLSKQLPK